MIPVLLLLLSVILFRIAPALAGSEAVKTMAGWSPLMAFALCGGAFFPRRWTLAGGLAAVVVPHVCLNSLQGYSIWDANLPLLIASVLLVSAWGTLVGPKAPVVLLLGLSLFSTVLFHLVSNTVSFVTDAGYVKSWVDGSKPKPRGCPNTRRKLGYFPRNNWREICFLL